MELKIREEDIGGDRDAFLSGIGREDRFVPIITLVVYCGTEHPWDGARCLHDLLDIDDEMKKYVTNYRLNLYDCHEHDTFDEYRSGLRQLFEVVRYSKEEEVLGSVIEQNREFYNRMDSDTRELIEVVAGVKISEEYVVLEKGAEKKDIRYVRRGKIIDCGELRREGKKECGSIW